VTRVDFYILKSDHDEARLELACRIANKAMQQDHHVFINSASEQECKRLDDLLWTFSQGSFVPHRIVTAEPNELPEEPVLIGHATEPTTQYWNLMINLADEVPAFFSRYERVAELVDGAQARREQGRERYRFYRDRGYPLNTHQL